MSDETVSEDRPEKIPDYIMVKILNQELGKVRAYVDELEHKLQVQDNITPAERKEIKKDKLIEEQQTQITQLQKTIRQLRKDKEDLIIRLNQKETNVNTVK